MLQNNSNFKIKSPQAFHYKKIWRFFKLGKSYKWKRFWCPREGNLNLSDGGYLYNPDSEWGKISNPDIVAFEAIIDVPCLVLLGEPGIGKSHSILEEHKDLEKLGNNTLLFELRSYGEDLFKDEKFLSWVENKYNFHLFIDDLDECMLRINNIPDILCRKFKKCKEYHNHLPKLRIACRTGVWPDNMEEGLKELWGKDNVKIYELAPLRRIDVIEAAEDNKLDPDSFSKEIQEKEAVPLAIKPITLNFLLNKYRKDGLLPANKTELYREGCRLLCEEQNKRRRGANLKGKFSVDHRMIIAGRIAAVMTFANKDAIWTETDQGNVPETDVKIEQLCKGSEFIDEQIDETLKITGLFSSCGVNHRRGWSHQTYKEFLAAWYLDQHKLSLAQIKSLLIHPDGKVVPQLYETVAWLANMKPEVFNEIIKIEPEILLRSDVADEKIREKLVSVLLKLYEEGNLLYDIRISGDYRKLSHPSMGAQLKPYLCDKNKNPAVMEAVINMARVCNLKILQNELVDIALDQCQAYEIRKDAARAITQIADDETKSKFKPLATGKAGDDPVDYLKGYGLLAVWPNYMTAKELFDNLTMPKLVIFGAPYQNFLSGNLVIHLQVADLPIALKWLKKQSLENITTYPFEQLSDSIILKTLDYLAYQDIMEVFAEFLIDRLRKFHGIIGENAILEFRTKLNNENRHHLVETILNMLSNPEEDLDYIFCRGTPLVIKEDITWIKQRSKSEKSEKRKLLWERLITILTKMYYDKKPDVLKRPKEKSEETNFDFITEKNIIILLNELKSGKLDTWGKFYKELTEKWGNIDKNTKLRVVKAIKNYMLNYEAPWDSADQQSLEAFKTYTIIHFLFQKAYDETYDISPDVWKKWAPTVIDSLVEIPAEDKEHIKIWKILYQNAPEEVINTLLYIINKINNHIALFCFIRKLTFCWDDKIIQILLGKGTDKKLPPNSMGILLGEVLTHKSKEAETFLKSLINTSLPASGEERDRAIVAASVLMMYAEDAGWSIIWPAIQKDVQFGREVMIKLACDIQYFDPYNKTLTRFKEDHLAELYIWINREFSTIIKTKDNTVGPEERVTLMGSFILRYIAYKGTYDGYEAVKKIYKELKEPDGFKWILTQAQKAMLNNTWALSPPKPEFIIELCSNKEKRLILSGNQLLDVLMESLERFQIKLQGKPTPAAIFLWNKDIRSWYKIDKKNLKQLKVNSDIEPLKKRKFSEEELKGRYKPDDIKKIKDCSIKCEDIYWPKEEIDLSDFVKLHLEDDLKGRIITDREPEIRRKHGSGKGERIDIQVRVATQDKVITVCNVKN
jgi:hypothetical protein